MLRKFVIFIALFSALSAHALGKLTLQQMCAAGRGIWYSPVTVTKISVVDIPGRYGAQYITFSYSGSEWTGYIDINAPGGAVGMLSMSRARLAEVAFLNQMPVSICTTDWGQENPYVFGMEWAQ